MLTESTAHEHGLPQLKHNRIKKEFIEPIRKKDKICVGSIAEGPFSYGYQADKEVVQKSTIEKHSTKESLTVEQKEAASTVIYSKDNVFLTGAAGTGKSFLLEYIIKRLTKKRKNGVYVTATTGIAAEHIHGTTLHSFAGIGLGKLPVEDLYESILSKESVLKRWRGAKVLVVDEVSMLHADLFDKLEQLARLVRSSTEPFGGIQLVLCGDFFQLPPVDRRNSSTNSIYAFQSVTWLKCNIQTITLTAVQRQTNTVFIDLLNEIRLGRFTKTAEELLRDCHSSRKTVPEDGILPTKLYCLNRNVDEENINHLNMLERSDYIYTGRDEWFPRSNIDSSSSSTATTSGSNNTKKRKHEAESMLTYDPNGCIQVSDELDRRAPLRLRLRIGAQVMFTKNIVAMNLVNGSRGVVVACTDHAPVVKFDNGSVLEVTIEKTTQGYEEGVVVRYHYPLRLAWALTVHKSQGMTLSRAELQLDRAFACGQVYVALSRVKSLDGLFIRGDHITPDLVSVNAAVLARFGEGGNMSASVPSSSSSGEGAGAVKRAGSKTHSMDIAVLLSETPTGRGQCLAGTSTAQAAVAQRPIPALTGPFSSSCTLLSSTTIASPTTTNTTATYDRGAAITHPTSPPALPVSIAIPATVEVIDLTSPPRKKSDGAPNRISGETDGVRKKDREDGFMSRFESILTMNATSNSSSTGSNKTPTATTAASVSNVVQSKPVNSMSSSSTHAVPKSAFLYFDGGSLGNPGVGGAGYLLCANTSSSCTPPHLQGFPATHTLIRAAVRMNGICTNNQAEYVGLIHGLQRAAQLGMKELIVYGDSELVIKQMKGVYKVKNPVMISMHKRASTVSQSFHSIQYNWIERGKNTAADAMSKQAMYHKMSADEAADWFTASK